MVIVFISGTAQFDLTGNGHENTAMNPILIASAILLCNKYSWMESGDIYIEYTSNFQTLFRV